MKNVCPYCRRQFSHAGVGINKKFCSKMCMHKANGVFKAWK